MAADAYYKWLTALEKVRVQKELLSLAESRVQNFTTRIRKGDLAKIYGLENEQYILKRKYELNSQEQKLYVSALYLSLFFRDKQGIPIILKPNNPSKIIDIKKKKVKNGTDLLNVVNQQDLTIKALQSQRVQTVADRKMGSNELLPKLDLKYEISEDRGIPETSLEPLEQKVFINLEIPIERRIGVGRREAAKAKQQALDFKIGFQMEKNQTEVQALLNNLKIFKTNFDLTKKEIDLANRLREAELVKFNKGASDFILVNFREESLAESKIKNVNAYLDYHLNFVELQRLAVDFMVPPK
jgi:outer membrane protein TolC